MIFCHEFIGKWMTRMGQCDYRTRTVRLILRMLLQATALHITPRATLHK